MDIWVFLGISGRKGTFEFRLKKNLPKKVWEGPKELFVLPGLILSSCSPAELDFASSWLDKLKNYHIFNLEKLSTSFRL